MHSKSRHRRQKNVPLVRWVLLRLSRFGANSFPPRLISHLTASLASWENVIPRRLASFFAAFFSASVVQ